MLKNRLIFGTSLFFLIGFYIATSSNIILILLALFLLTFFVSQIFLLITKNKVELRILLSKANKKSNQYVQLEVIKKTILPIGVIKLRIQYENVMYQEKKQLNAGFYAYNETYTRYALPWESSDCGDYHLEVSKIRICDFLGLFCVKRDTIIPSDHLVYPQTVDIEILQGHQVKLAKEGDRYDLYHSGNDLSEVFALKDYQEGDSLNHIHWKLSSKLMKTIVREFGKPINDELTILCDSGFYNFQNNHELVNGVLSMTAAVSRALVSTGIGHQLCAAQGELLFTERIHSQNDVVDALTELIHMHLSDASKAYGLWKISTKTERSILITGYLQDELLAELGKQTDLMVILLTDADEEHVEVRDDYRILALPVSHLQEKIHNIEI